MDRLFDEAFTRPIMSAGGVEMPAIDLYQTNDEVVIKAALPGLDPNDIQIDLTADVLTLRGNYRQEDEVKDATYHIREHRHGMFERSVILPAAVQPDKARAEFDKGILP
jgi:HSP20 family protein